jgi:mannosylglycerate hydrolase
MGTTLHVVSHSHWDREWHRTFQQFRLRLVRLIDDVLDVTGGGDSFPFFMLDGQTIILDDYLEIRPERAEELRARIGEGRVSIGPWYIHPDEFLVSGEAIVRNLLQGAQSCAMWGGRMAVGYVPDQFGHITQLPQILRGFGIDNAVFWRGVERSAGLAFTWRGHDGTEVLAATLPDGYSSAERLPAGGQAMAERLRALARSLGPLAVANSPLLIMNGGDHTTVQPEAPSGLAEAREVLGDEYTVLHSTLPRYIADLEALGIPLTTIEGELRSSRDAFLLPAVLSARIWIKQRNNRAQILLERFAEPTAAIAAALGARYPGGELRQAWRYLLQNQPHDSICGCSIDQVHREMVTRYDWSEQIAAAIGDEALAAIAARVNSVIPGAEDPHTLALTIFNGSPTPTGGPIDVPLHLIGEASSYALVDENGRHVLHTWIGERGESPTMVELPREEVPDLASIMAQVDGNRVFGLGIAEISMRTMGDALQVEVTTSDQAILTRDQLEQSVRDAFALADVAGSTRAVATIHRSVEMRLAALAPEVPALGYRTLLLRPRRKDDPSAPANPPMPELPLSIENERHRVEIDAVNGGLTIIDIGSGLTLGPANVFVDGGDAGDLYTYAAPGSDTIVTTGDGKPEIERETSPLGQTLRLRHVLRVPRELAASRWERDSSQVDLTITTSVRLAPGDSLIRFHTVVENAALDHRLRVHIAVPFAVDHAHAEDAFAMVRRAAQPDRDGDWAEQPVGTAPHQGVVAIHGAGASCVLAARGLPEYEILERTSNTSELALTLLRCVGWLSRSDIETRPGDAGPSIATPDAQCLGAYTFEYALVFGAEPWRELLPTARAFSVPLRVSVGPCAEGGLPATAPLVGARPAAIVVSALKGAEDGRGSILRVYNDDVVAHDAELFWCLPVYRATRVDLAETDQAVLFEGEQRDSVSMEIPAGGIASLRLEWA